MSEGLDHGGKPGSAGEHSLQERFGSQRRAAAFYDHQMLDHLNPLMLEYLGRQEMAFIATSDASGECDCSFRAGPPGFIRALDERTVLYPEFKGNGVMASLGNMAENPHVGILFVDFYDSAVGLHINGHARLIDDASLRALWHLIDRTGSSLPETTPGAKGAPDRWVLVQVDEAYIHCSKHIPLMARLDKESEWASGAVTRPGGDFFRAKHSPRPWTAPSPSPSSAIASDAPVPVPAPAPAVPETTTSGGPVGPGAAHPAAEVPLQRLADLQPPAPPRATVMPSASVPNVSAMPWLPSAASNAAPQSSSWTPWPDQEVPGPVDDRS